MSCPFQKNGRIAMRSKRNSGTVFTCNVGRDPDCIMGQAHLLPKEHPDKKPPRLGGETKETGVGRLRAVLPPTPPHREGERELPPMPHSH